MSKFFFEYLAFEDVPTKDGRPDTTTEMTKDAKGNVLDILSFKKLSIYSERNWCYYRFYPYYFTPPLPLVPRVHYRLVMKEEGTPLRDCFNLKSCLCTLLDLNERESFLRTINQKLIVLGQSSLHLRRYRGCTRT
jgi:hypothetical protein